MNIYRVKDYDAMSRKAASILAAQIVADPESVLGLATGSTPLGTYQYLRDWYQAGSLDFSEVQTVNLDEYKGIAEEEQSYRHYMVENFFRHINIKEEHTHIPDGSREDGGPVCKEYEALIERLGGIDMQLLGIGRNGHIGFNEPADIFAGACHCVDLAESTIEANRRFFEKEEDVPRQAYTMGIGTIMHAEKILLLASGKDKAKALCQMLEGPVTPQVPASVLKLHRNVTVIADEAALSEISRDFGGYYH